MKENGFLNQDEYVHPCPTMINAHTCTFNLSTKKANWLVDLRLEGGLYEMGHEEFTTNRLEDSKDMFANVYHETLFESKISKPFPRNRRHTYM